MANNYPKLILQREQKYANVYISKANTKNMTDTLNHQEPPPHPDEPESPERQDYVDDEGNLHIVMPWTASEDQSPEQIPLPPAEQPPSWTSASPRETHYGKAQIEGYRQAVGERNEADRRNIEIEAALGETAAAFLGIAEEVASKPDDELAREDYEAAAEAARQDIEKIRGQVQKKYPDGNETVLREMGLTPEGDMSDEAIKAFYLSRLDKLDTAGMEHQERLDGLRKDFMTALTWAAKRGLPVDLARAKERVDAIQIKLFDGTLHGVAEEDEKDISVGFYDSATDEVGVAHDYLLRSVELNPKDEVEVKRAVFHELLHAVAGMRVTDSYGFVDRQRQGLRREQGLTWLNEAVTERLAALLSGMHTMSWSQRRKINFAKMDVEKFFNTDHWKVPTIDKTVYTHEQRGLKAILYLIPSKQKPIQTLLGSYFEDYEPGGHGNKPGRQPMRKKLFNMMHTVVDMPAIDRIYATKGGKVFEKTVAARTEYEAIRRSSLRPSRRADSRLHKLDDRRDARKLRREVTQHNIEDWHRKRAA